MLMSIRDYKLPVLLLRNQMIEGTRRVELNSINEQQVNDGLVYVPAPDGNGAVRVKVVDRKIGKVRTVEEDIIKTNYVYVFYRGRLN